MKLLIQEPKSLKALARKVFKGDLSAKEIKELPSIAAFQLLKYNGINSSLELIENLSKDQMQITLDLDLWIGDEINEKALIPWFSLADQTDTNEPNLEILKQVLVAIDYKILAILICKYIDILYYEEPTDAPPNIEYKSPDKGRTWIKIKSYSEEFDFLIQRILTLIFETNPDTFYQLLSVKGVASKLELEESCFNEKEKRLQTEGVPSSEESLIYNHILKPEQVLNKFKISNKQVQTDLPNLFFYDQFSSKFLELEKYKYEINKIIHTAIVHFKIRIYQIDETLDLFDFVKANINLGFDYINSNTNLEVDQILETIDIRTIYRIGLSFIYKLTNKVKDINSEEIKSLFLNDREKFAYIFALKLNPPKYFENFVSKNLEIANILESLEFSFISTQNKFHKIDNLIS